MNQLEEIRRDIAPWLEELNKRMKARLESSNPLMNSIIAHYMTTKGKQIRPVMVILAAMLLGDVNGRTLSSAAAVELLHNASLIHDDVVDDTVTRRDTPTVNGLWGNHIAVLVGDFFVSMSLQEAISTGDNRAVDAVARLGQLLSIGEIDQIYNVREHTLDERAYFQVIDRKTASLFVACAEMGAFSVDAQAHEVEILKQWAHLLGECFQIKDDIFDYSHGDVGKPTGHDLLEGKITLPLLHVLAADPRGEMAQLALGGNLTPDHVERLLEHARAGGGIDYAYGVMQQLHIKSRRLLAQLPQGAASKMLDDLFCYVISRQR